MSIMKWIQRIKKRRNKGYTEGERVMKLVIQRCQEASVSVDGKTVGAIEKGLMVLIGVGKEDTTEVVDKYLKKLLQLRIFEDENGKTNRSLMDIGGQLLLVSQFT